MLYLSAMLWASGVLDRSFGLTVEMRKLASEAAQPPAGRAMVTAILTAYLRHSGNPHRRGSFMSTEGLGRTDTPQLSSMYKVADLMLAASPTMCMPNVHVHVVHDLVANGSYSRSDITYHGFPPAPWRPPDVQRFVLYAQLLRRIAWDCAFAIDISDVNMLNVPPCHALPQRLVIGSDSNDNWFLKWLRKAARINGLLGTLHAPFEAMLNGSSSQAGLPFRPANVGVVGGCRGTFGPILSVWQAGLRPIGQLQCRARSPLRATWCSGTRRPCA